MGMGKGVGRGVWNKGEGGDVSNKNWQEGLHWRFCQSGESRRKMVDAVSSPAI